ncbi:hypothetical protein N7447_004331 [Penicillium robsamsonii]|uniref:uncharacterized protein n=1 Tax=Penicillium robsamsonii TaxID=1792511 RepID=UPI0025490135|nr:uncharacterized protein N7447_004331 [Penicillium robsamsonii]KAJ5827568.1 hypothetical protein N7447_004331 [Penicillium robsamsonii]
MTKTQYTFPPGSTVLVTGANAYIGSHVINILLGLGYRVRGTVRTPRPWLNEYFDTRYGKGLFETILITDFKDPSAFDHALTGVSGIVHMAQAMPWDPANSDPVGYTVAGTLNVLRAASREPSIKRVVLASSIVAAGYPEVNTPFRFDTDSWEKATPETAISIYTVCKTEGERQAWKWVEENQPSFVLNTVLPWMNFGRTLHPEIGSSGHKWIRGLLKGDPFPFKVIPIPWFIDVEDSARLHVIGLLSTEVNSERLFGAAAPFVWSDITGIMKKADPMNKLIPEAPPTEKPSVGEVVPAQRAENLIRTFFGRPGWTTLEDCIKATVKTA